MSKNLIKLFVFINFFMSLSFIFGVAIDDTRLMLLALGYYIIPTGFKDENEKLRTLLNKNEEQP